MIPAWSYGQICRGLSFAFQNRYKKGLENYVRMVGILFARPSSLLAQAEIIPNLYYFHHRSGNHIDFFCGGYGQFWQDRRDEFPDQKVVFRNGFEWLFSPSKFNDFRQEIESMTKWRYNGGVDLILTNAKYDKDSEKAFLDFSSAIAVNLDRAKKDGAIDNVENFFEKIFQFAENQTGNDPTWGFSTKMELKVAGSALKSVLLSLLPRALRQEVRKAIHFLVVDIGK